MADLLPDRAAIRHDLRTPLNAILGYSDLLAEELRERAPDLIPDLDKVQIAGRRLLALIDTHLSDGAASPGPDRTVVPATNTAVVREPLFTGTILVVDDIGENRDLLTRHLERQGHTVLSAENGQVALEILAGQELDVVLLDVMMPILDGPETLRLIKSDPQTEDLPVLMISALNELDSVVRCIEAGAEDYLSKPFEPTLLRARLDACLERKRRRDRERAYFEAVAEVEQAARAVEERTFSTQLLDGVADRDDELGRLARVFQRMAHEVIEREERLTRQVEELKIEIDAVKQRQQVSEITETDYFRSLQSRARSLREGRDRTT